MDEWPIKLISTLQEAAVAMGVLLGASEVIAIDLESQKSWKCTCVEYQELGDTSLPNRARVSLERYSGT